MKQSFGKGIESLIPIKNKKIIKKPIKKKVAIFYIDIQKIKPNPFQPRKQFDLEAIQSLADSIREYGILQPLIATKIESSNIKGDGMKTEYQLIAGERRLMASKMIGLEQVPIIIREPTDKEKLEVSLIENIQRLNLNLIEKAEAFDKLYREFGLKHHEIGDMAGMGRVAVTNNIRLLSLPDEIKQALREEKISEGHARAILLVKEPKKQKAVFDKILKDGLNVREAEYFAKKLNIWKPAKNNLKSEVIDEFRNLEMRIKNIFGVGAKTIKIGVDKGRPKLTVFFSSKNEIERLIKKLS